jgi:hypothetical protein
VHGLVSAGQLTWIPGRTSNVVPSRLAEGLPEVVTFGVGVLVTAGDGTMVWTIEVPQVEAAALSLVSPV